jgi:hypothetical protein
MNNFAAFMLFMLGALFGVILLGAILIHGGKLDPCPVCPKPAVVKEIEYVHTETVVEPSCKPCLEIRTEEEYIWVYKEAVPVAFFPRKFLISQ